MPQYDQEDWVRLYQEALLELEHAKMAGRIGDARIGIAARIEKLASLGQLLGNRIITSRETGARSSGI